MNHREALTSTPNPQPTPRTATRHRRTTRIQRQRLPKGRPNSDQQPTLPTAAAVEDVQSSPPTLDETAAAMKAATKALAAARAAIRAAEALLAGVERPRNHRTTQHDWVDARGSGLGVRTFRRIARQGGFPAHRVGRRLLARRRHIDAYIEQHRVAPRQEAEATLDPFDRALANGTLTQLRGGRSGS